MRLKGKITAITGAATGLGEATALLFAEEGAHVVVADFDDAGGERTVSEIRKKGAEALFVHADISKEADARGIAEEAVRVFGGIDILVNNAAVFVLKGFDATVAEWQRSLGINVVGTALVTKYMAEVMKKNGRGAIVNLSSVSAWIAPGERQSQATRVGEKGR